MKSVVSKSEAAGVARRPARLGARGHYERGLQQFQVAHRRCSNLANEAALATIGPSEGASPF
jgi:hypothetical protein